LEKAGTICSGENHPKSPPFEPEGPVDFSLASAAKSIFSFSS